MTRDYNSVAEAADSAHCGTRNRCPARNALLHTIIPNAVPLAQSGSTRCAAQVFSRHERSPLNALWRA